MPKWHSLPYTHGCECLMEDLDGGVAFCVWDFASMG